MPADAAYDTFLCLYSDSGSTYLERLPKIYFSGIMLLSSPLQQG